MKNTTVKHTQISKKTSVEGKHLTRGEIALKSNKIMITGDRKPGRMTVEEFREYIKNNSVKPKSKYNAKPKEVDGLRFDSTKEADKYVELKYRQNANEITGLQRQVKFKLVGCNYFLDFMYFDYELKQMVYLDVKGVKTSTYKMKKKQMLELYKIEIKES